MSLQHFPVDSQKCHLTIGSCKYCVRHLGFLKAILSLPEKMVLEDLSRERLSLLRISWPIAITGRSCSLGDSLLSVTNITVEPRFNETHAKGLGKLVRYI